MFAFKTVLKASLVVASTCFTVAACSSDDETPATGHDHDDDHDHDNLLPFCDLPKSCQEIVEACHTKDDVSDAEVHECHETGHEVGTDEACSKVHDDCIAKCNAAPDLGGEGEGALESCDDGGAG